MSRAFYQTLNKKQINYNIKAQMSDHHQIRAKSHKQLPLKLQVYGDYEYVKVGNR